MDAYPVIVLTDPAQLDDVLSGARRAGGVAPLTFTWTGPDAIRAVPEGGEVVVVSCVPDEVTGAARALLGLGAHPIPTLAVEGDAVTPRVSPGTLSLLSDPALSDLEIPVPAAEDGPRRRLWDQLRSVGAADRHHLVEVDGGPADGWTSRAAAAAGVLAGRRVAGNRRWRDELGG